MRTAHAETIEGDDAGVGAVDWLLAALAWSVAIALIAIELIFIPAFREMFQAYGGALPFVTRLVIEFDFALGSGVVASSISFGGLFAKRRFVRRTVLVTSIGLGLFGLVGTFAALYWPVFALAGAIQP